MKPIIENRPTGSETSQAKVVNAAIENEWRENPAVRAEFREFSCYAAYRRAEMVGRVSIHGLRASDRRHDLVPRGAFDNSRDVDDYASMIWNAKPAIRAEFREFGAFLAYVRADSAGLVGTSVPRQHEIRT